VHYRCPAVAAREDWVRDVLNCWNYAQDSRSLRDVEDQPTAALVESMVLLATEIGDRESQRRVDREIEESIRRGRGTGRKGKAS